MRIGKKRVSLLLLSMKYPKGSHIFHLLSEWLVSFGFVEADRQNDDTKIFFRDKTWNDLKIKFERGFKTMKLSFDQILTPHHIF